MKSKSAWRIKYDAVAEIDDLKQPECADELILLLFNITGSFTAVTSCRLMHSTERYKLIPELKMQLQFLEHIQLKLLRAFHDEVSISVAARLQLAKLCTV